VIVSLVLAEVDDSGFFEHKTGDSGLINLKNSWFLVDFEFD